MLSELSPVRARISAICWGFDTPLCAGFLDSEEGEGFLAWSGLQAGVDADFVGDDLENVLCRSWR